MNERDTVVSGLRHNLIEDKSYTYHFKFSREAASCMLMRMLKVDHQFQVEIDICHE